MVFGLGVLLEALGALGVLGPPESGAPLEDGDVELSAEPGPVEPVAVVPEDPGEPLCPLVTEPARVGEGLMPKADALRPPEPLLAHAVAAMPTMPRTATAFRACRRVGK